VKEGIAQAISHKKQSDRDHIIEKTFNVRKTNNIQKKGLGESTHQLKGN